MEVSKYIAAEHVKEVAQGIALELVEDCVILGRRFEAGEVCYLKAKQGVDVEDWIELHTYIVDRDGVWTYLLEEDTLAEAFLPTWS
jgi:hypothetical protein